MCQYTCPNTLTTNFGATITRKSKNAKKKKENTKAEF